MQVGDALRCELPAWLYGATATALSSPILAVVSDTMALPHPNMASMAHYKAVTARFWDWVEPFSVRKSSAPCKLSPSRFKLSPSGAAAVTGSNRLEYTNP